MHIVIFCVVTLFSMSVEASSEQDFVREMQALGFDQTASLLKRAEKKDTILKLIARPAEKRLVWHEYRNIFLKKKRIDAGVAFYKQHQVLFEKAEDKFGIPAEVILGILGVETFYGRIKGNYRVLDALYTLGFHYPKRGKFFRGQLKEFIRMTQHTEKKPWEFYGSYAGAMGMAQFIPSSYLAYTADYDGDGFVDLWNNPGDTIWSIANYLHKHGYRPGKEVLIEPTKQGDDKSLTKNKLGKPKYTASDLLKKGYIFPPQPKEDKFLIVEREFPQYKQIILGGYNLYVITRYNHSFLYAMAVYELGTEVMQAAQTQGDK